MLRGKMINRVFRKFLENIYMIQGYEAFITLYMRHVSKLYVNVYTIVDTKILI